MRPRLLESTSPSGVPLWRRGGTTRTIQWTLAKTGNTSWTAVHRRSADFFGARCFWICWVPECPSTPALVTDQEDRLITQTSHTPFQKQQHTALVSCATISLLCLACLSQAGGLRGCTHRPCWTRKYCGVLLASPVNWMTLSSCLPRKTRNSAGIPGPSRFGLSPGPVCPAHRDVLSVRAAVCEVRCDRFRLQCASRGLRKRLPPPTQGSNQ